MFYLINRNVVIGNDKNLDIAPVKVDKLYKIKNNISFVCNV